jgi:hypothetical protein
MHIFNNITYGYQLDSWISHYSSVQLIISSKNVLIIVIDDSLLDYYQMNELVRSSKMQIKKYIPRMYFFLKRYLPLEYDMVVLGFSDKIKKMARVRVSFS